MLPDITPAFILILLFILLVTGGVLAFVFWLWKEDKKLEAEYEQSLSRPTVKSSNQN